MAPPPPLTREENERNAGRSPKKKKDVHEDLLANVELVLVGSRRYCCRPLPSPSAAAARH
jgi:hypothetical protein